MTNTNVVRDIAIGKGTKTLVNQAHPNTQVRIEVTYRQDMPSLDEYGEFRDEIGEFTIDRYKGLLYGQRIEKSVRVLGLTNKNQRIEELTNSGYEIIEFYPIGVEPLDSEQLEWCIEVEGYEILKRDLPTYTSGIKPPYFRCNENNLPHSPEAWGYVGKERIDELIKEHGSLLNVDIAYALEDWQRAEGYGINWDYLDVTAFVLIDGYTIAESVTFEIESDTDEGSAKELLDDVYYSALEQADLWITRNFPDTYTLSEDGWEDIKKQ